MSPIENVFIVEPDDQGWIIERLMRDVASELAARGIPTRIGPGDAYAGEAVVFNSRYLTALSDPRARINSLFITHVDDRVKEMQLRSRLGDFGSFVCMSAHDADFVAAVNGSRAGVVGIELPARDLSVRPVHLAMFSACYEDGRKNEDWIAEYLRERPAGVRQAFVFCFLGWGWEGFCSALGKLDANYEIVRFSRFTPGEYRMYREKLAGMDALIYLGFDGGAMSVYDGISAGLEVIAPDISYHRGLGGSVRLFADRAGFFGELDRLERGHAERVAALKGRSVAAYVDRLVEHWNALLGGEPDARAQETLPLGTAEAEALDLFRDHYKALGPSRIRSALIRVMQNFFASGRGPRSRGSARDGAKD